MKTSHLAGVLFACGPLLAQRVTLDAAVRTSDKPYVLATGEATLAIKPDQAVLDFSVVTQASSAVSAAEKNAKQTDAVLADLHKLLAPTDQIKTIAYAVRPNTQFQKINGYTATNTVEVVLYDLTQVGKIIDGALQSGANNVQKVDFGLKNPQAARSQALRAAAAQAKASAESIADGLGVHVVRILAAEESAPDEDLLVRKKAPAFAAARSVAPTEIEAETVEITATVTLRVEVAP